MGSTNKYQMKRESSSEGGSNERANTKQVTSPLALKSPNIFCPSCKNSSGFGQACVARERTATRFAYRITIWINPPAPPRLYRLYTPCCTAKHIRTLEHSPRSSGIYKHEGKEKSKCNFVARRPRDVRGSIYLNNLFGVILTTELTETLSKKITQYNFT